MNLRDTLSANLALPRAPLAGVGWVELADGRVLAPIGWGDAEADADWALSLLAGYGIGRGDHCLFVTSGSEYWPLQLGSAVTRLGGFIGNIGAAAYEDRRLSVYLRFLPPRAVFGLSEALAVKVAGSAELAALVAKVPHVLALPAAVPVLAGAGITARAISPVGPALALPCADGDGSHVDGSQFGVSQLPGTRSVAVSTTATRKFRLSGAEVSTCGTVLPGCACGRPGPVLNLL
jgi:hypothetical protein